MNAETRKARFDTKREALVKRSQNLRDLFAWQRLTEVEYKKEARANQVRFDRLDRQYPEEAVQFYAERSAAIDAARARQSERRANA